MARQRAVVQVLMAAVVALVVVGCAPAASPTGAKPSAPMGGQAAPASGTAPGGTSTAPVGTSGAPAEAGPLKELIDGARREGALTFVWGAGTMGGNDGVRRLAATFNKAYGLNLDVSFTPGPSMPEMASRRYLLNNPG